jgi:hypothetical protein
MALKNNEKLKTNNHRIEILNNWNKIEAQSKVSISCTNTLNLIHLISFSRMVWHKAAVYYALI